jgi:hypothetical protein
MYSLTSALYPVDIEVKKNRVWKLSSFGVLHTTMWTKENV